METPIWGTPMTMETPIWGTPMTMESPIWHLDRRFGSELLAAQRS